MTIQQRLVKPVSAAAAVAVGLVLLRRFGPDRKELIAQIFERLPPGFPPKWMHSNITAIREQGERILQVLEESEGVARERPREDHLLEVVSA